MRRFRYNQWRTCQQKYNAWRPCRYAFPPPWNSESVILLNLLSLLFGISLNSIRSVQLCYVIIFRFIEWNKSWTIRSCFFFKPACVGRASFVLCFTRLFTLTHVGRKISCVPLTNVSKLSLSLLFQPALSPYPSAEIIDISCSLWVSSEGLDVNFGRNIAWWQNLSASITCSMISDIP